MDNTKAGRIKLLADANVKIGDPATLQNGWKGHVASIEGGYVWVRVPGKTKHLYQCAPWAVNHIKEAMNAEKEKAASLESPPK